MLLIDRNNNPRNTVFFVSNLIYKVLFERQEMSADELYSAIFHESGEIPNRDFFTMALDFLFLIGKVDLSEEGLLYVH